MTSIIIFAICIVLLVWDRYPMATVAIGGCVAMVIAGVCDFKTAFAPFASSTVIFLIGVMIIGAGISNTGLAETIGRWIVKVAGNSEKKLVFCAYLASALLSAFLANSTVVALFIPIVLSIAVADPKMKSRNLMMPIAIGCAIGGASTLVGSTQQMTAQGLLENMGERTFRVFDFTPIGAVLILAGLVYCVTVGIRRGERIWGDREEVGMVGDTDKRHYDKRKMIIMAVIFALTVVLYVTEWLPLPITTSLSALLCIVTGCLKQNEAVSAVNWNVIGRLAGCLGMAEALEAGGGTDIISDVFHSLVGNSMSPFLLFCLVILFTLVITEIVSNSTVIMIILPTVLSVAPSLGINAYAFSLGITLAAGVPLSCPLGSNLLSISMSVGYTNNDFFRYSFFLDVIQYLIIIMMVPLLYGLTV